MQTVCRVGIGSTQTVKSANRRSTRHNEGHTRNRSALLFTCAPLAALAAFVGISGIVQKQAQARDAVVLWGQLTARDARTMAKQELTELLGPSAGTVTVENASPQEGVLFRREGRIKPITTHSWYVTLNTESAQFLVRLNADTKQIYAVNRFDTKSNSAPEDDVDALEAATSETPEHFGNNLLSKTEGEMMVRQCLRQLGLSTAQMTALPARAIHSYGDNNEATPLWEFSYECPTNGWGTRKLRICIDRRTGNLENIWNPAAVLTAS